MLTAALTQNLIAKCGGTPSEAQVFAFLSQMNAPAAVVTSVTALFTTYAHQPPGLDKIVSTIVNAL
jgi:hypothetical protein